MPARLALLCLPCAGASATMYLRWRRLLPTWVAVQPIELPGRGSRLGEPFAERFDALVEQLCDEHRGALAGPCALLGHSMGALLAYGMTRRLQAQGMTLPRLLIVSGSPAPSRRDQERYAGRHDDERLLDDLRRQGGTPPDVFAHPELLRMTLDTLGADYRICDSFRQASDPSLPRLPVPLQVLAGREDDIAPARIRAWSEEIAGPYGEDWFDGGHFFIRHSEQEVLRTLTRRLQGAVPGGTHETHAIA
ncbi:thioesterase II family protein [Roseateles sp.]|uniref:thioesterase II family protein n=1 Tax=Roseateles sp. TaxID=1971397 RepID=UPI0039E97568